MNAQTFLTYTDRYDRIMASLPEGVRTARFERSTEIWAADPRVESAYLQYYNMCSEEFYLHEKGYLDSELWIIWEDEIKRTARSVLGRAMWMQLQHEFESYPEFRQWIRNAQANGLLTAPASAV